MAKLSRRGFIKRTSLGAAAAGALAAAPSLGAGTVGTEIAATDLAAADLAGPLVAHVSDVASGELSVLAGTREVVIRDPELIARLVRALR
jgi:hypothetical protein